MQDRYESLFARAGKNAEGVFIPFAVIGDPDLETSFSLICSMVEAGADALELGLPFSDPVADGPTIQKAGERALRAGATVEGCLCVVKRIREKFSDLPIGLLVYANLVEANGPKTFFDKAGGAGVDSVLMADVPECEISPYQASARGAGIKTVLILPMGSDEKAIRRIARRSQGYLYLLSRKGVTGAETGAGLPERSFIEKLKKLGSAPPVLGFGISAPEQVRQAIEVGCRGVISGSAVVAIIEEIASGTANSNKLRKFIGEMKKAAKVQKSF